MRLDLQIIIYIDELVYMHSIIIDREMFVLLFCVKNVIALNFLLVLDTQFLNTLAIITLKIWKPLCSRLSACSYCSAMLTSITTNLIRFFWSVVPVRT